MHGPTCIFWANLTPFSLAQNPLWQHVAIVFFGPTPPSRISYRHLVNAGHAANVYYLHGLYDVDDLERCALDEVRIGLYPIVTFPVQLSHFIPGFLSYSVPVFLK